MLARAHARADNARSLKRRSGSGRGRLRGGRPSGRPLGGPRREPEGQCDPRGALGRRSRPSGRSTSAGRSARRRPCRRSSTLRVRLAGAMACRASDRRPPRPASRRGRDAWRAWCGRARRRRVRCHRRAHGRERHGGGNQDGQNSAGKGQRATLRRRRSSACPIWTKGQASMLPRPQILARKCDRAVAPLCLN